MRILDIEMRISFPEILPGLLLRKLRGFIQEVISVSDESRVSLELPVEVEIGICLCQ